MLKYEKFVSRDIFHSRKSKVRFKLFVSFRLFFSILKRGKRKKNIQVKSNSLDYDIDSKKQSS